MEAIPPTLSTDPEDVAWALQTAETLWKRHERADAIVWLRRAAQAAGDAEQDDRALALARHAAELSDWMAQNPVGAPDAATVASEPPAAGGGVDDLLRVSMADIPISVSELDDMQEAPTEMLQRPPAPAPRLEDSQEVPTEMLQRPPARVARLEESQEVPTEMLSRPSRPSAPAHWPAPEPSPLAETRELARTSEVDTPEGGAPIAPPAQQVHAGILDPWAQVPPPPPTAPISDTDFVTSAELPAAPRTLAAEPAAAPPPAQAAPPQVAPPPVQVAPPPVQVAPPPVQVGPPPAQPPAGPAPGTPAPPKRKPPPLPKKPPVPKKPPARTAAKRRPSIPPEPEPISVAPSSLQVQEEEKFYTSDPMAVLRAARTSQPPAVEVAPPPPPVDAPPPPAPEPMLREEAPTRKSEVLPETAEAPLRLSTGELRAAVPYLAGSQLPTMEVEALPEAPRVEALPEAPQVEALPEAPRVEALPEAPKVEALPETTGPRLDDVDALADLPDDERAALSRTAAVQALSKDEEIEGFALAMVLEGSVDVAATIADAPAERLAAGTMLKAKGTLAEESVPLKLVASENGTVVATWTAEQIEHTFRSCPWVEDDLRAQANRVQALVGLTLGALAERLDASLRMQFTSRLDVRELVEGEVIVEAGQPMRTMVVVGQGKLELVEGDATKQELGPGDFLFPTEILGAGVAPQTARAGKGGALVLCADRGLAQELMITCPPLLEIFAGM